MLGTTNSLLSLAAVLVFCGMCLSDVRAAEGRESSYWRAFRDAADRSPPEIIPDFSYAGYERGREAIPDVSGPVFRVTDYGAVADDDLCDEEAIRKAVAAAEKAGGGVVLFPPGKFLVWCDRKHAQPVCIVKSGVVVRGAGAFAGGTVIRAIHSGYLTGPYPVPKGTKDADGKDDWSKIPYVFMFEADRFNPPEPVRVEGAVKRGGSDVRVESSAGFRAGDWVALRAKTHKLDEELLANLKMDPTWTRVVQDGAGMSEIHQIAEVRDDILVLREPILLNLGEGFGATVSRVPMIERVGVEDLTIQGGWRGTFVHHRSALDDEGWDGIQFKGVANGWVRRCAFVNLNTGIYLRDSACCSLLENRFAGNKGHYDAAIRSSCSFNLSGLVDDQEGPQHSASTGNCSAGTVVWRWRMAENSTVDSHGNCPYATLIDRVDGGTMTRSGGPAPAFPNHLRWMVFWNFSYGGDDKQPVDFWNYVKGKEAKFVKPLFVGLHGKPLELKTEALAANELPGAPVEPESLYEAQLALRLGAVPAWVEQARGDWEKSRSRPLQPFLLADIAGDIHKEDFPLADLLSDWAGLMAGQELGWGVEIALPDKLPSAVLHQDYVLLRTVLQAMATYATPLPAKDQERSLLEGKTAFVPLPALKVDVAKTGREITIGVPVLSDAKAQSKNSAALRKARELAAACGASLVDEPGALKLSLPL